MKKRLVWIGTILLALLLAAYLVVPNWILAKPREALIESVRQELAADWQSEAVAFAGEGSYGGETVLWFTIETPEKTQYKAAVCRVLENGRYWLTKIENPSTYCSDIVSYLAVYLVNNLDCRTIITKGSTSDGEIRIDLTPEELDAAFRPNTKLVFGETIANPALTVLDIERFAQAAHRHGVPLVVDNTFATPINCRPIEWGADIVTHSTTKYMDGHAAALGGAIVDGGNFDWMAHADKFPGLCTPDESYHGVTYAEKFGNAGAFITKCTAQLMRDFGSMQSPQSAFYLNLGLESLHVRVPRHCENAQAVAEYLSKHPKVETVHYCGLPTDPYYKTAQKYLPNGSCGVVCFELRGGREAAGAFMRELKLAAIETHVADARTCCLSPASTTHRQMTDEQLKAAGVPAGLIRLSCGLENKEDLISDIANALEAIPNAD